jgi:hypothetical protein
VVQALQEAQEQVQELAQQQARVLGLAAELVQGLVPVQAVAQVLEERAEVLAQLALVEAEEQVEVLEPGQLTELTQAVGRESAVWVPELR